MSAIAYSMIEGLRLQGEHADRLLAEAGLILTQGGEPTFIPEKPSGPEWNLEALGEQKLRLAWNLSRALEKSLMPGAVILRSNGKQYPGEPIPRWKLMLLKKKGTPLWNYPALLSQGKKGKKPPVSPRKFLSSLATILGVSGSLRPVYEDVEAAMRAAAMLGETPPIPRYSRNKKGFVQPRWTTAERKRWQELHRAAGWVLPLDCIKGVWKTDNWVLADGGDLLLLPGTSSIGLRLPLSQLPEGRLPRALTAEIREGALTLFIPPFLEASSFAALLSAIEQTAETLHSAPISLEGYPPPHEDGWESLAIIPDPGVIEVNLPPAPDWRSLEKTAAALFQAAEECGLRGTRLLPSGEVAATGGGGHLVLGGDSLSSNPFLLKPHLLPSFLRFIQRHPSLSYLFSGRFVGPSSQAPRIDESFFEIPRELGLSLTAMEMMEAPASAVMIDAFLRNLLLDYNGNTHKAEVSVDKFFNPFMPNGRLGLVEFRSIEMSPDIGQFLAVQALWRALAATFVHTPYKEPLIDWKGRLHDDFLLPFFLEEDLDKVLGYLNDHDGFHFEREWFQQHLKFRFPILAEEKTNGTAWHLRRALEPWPLLGEQPTPSGGLVRCVDSSTERLEVRLFAPSRERSKPPVMISVNGWKLPLHPHPEGGFIGAVRFRTFLLPTCLHPQVMPHTPLLIQFLEESGKLLSSWNYHPIMVDHGKEPRYLIPAETPRIVVPPKVHPTQRNEKTLDLLTAI
ncbi:MAG: transglutaminase family protein [bacterium]